MMRHWDYSFYCSYGLTHYSLCLLAFTFTRAYLFALHERNIRSPYIQFNHLYLTIRCKFFEYNKFVINSDLITPEALRMLQAVASEGSLAGAARKLGLVPSALTYRVRQIEEGLDVLLFDRRARKATLTDAGQELVREAERILNELDGLAQRVKRVATGWEAQFTIAVGGLISQETIMELTAAFFALDPPTQLKIRIENLSGAWEALEMGLADLVIGSTDSPASNSQIVSKPLGEVPFVFAVAPDHPLANAPEPLHDELIGKHRAVAVADSARKGPTITVGLLPGQRILTVDSIQTKLDAQLRGLGCGFLPQCMAQPYIDAKQLITKRISRPPRVAKLGYGWRTPSRHTPSGKALAWWIARLQSDTTRKALLHR
jgi:DNA-binding transcriptional LysR family regulator